jgi:hypothetical protein
MKKQDSERQDGWDSKNSFYLLLILVSGLTACVTPFMRRNCGREYPGIAGLIGGGIILLLMGQTRDPAMPVFFWCWLAALVVMRLQSWQVRRRGAVVHSRYGGDSWLIQKLPFVKSPQQARLLEVPLCLLVGALLAPVSEFLGGFIFLCALAMALEAAIEAQRNYVQVTRAQDAQIEMQVFQQRMQGQRQDY